MKELIVETKNPGALDAVLVQMGGMVGQNPDGTYRADENGRYTVRGANVDYLKFAMTAQGYAKVVGEREIASPLTGDSDA
jgi:hypothetical protein